MADAATSKIFRTWTVAERYIKTTPDSNWDDFVNVYGSVEEAIDNGGDEPESYNCLNPIIPQVANAGNDNHGE